MKEFLNFVSSSISIVKKQAGVYMIKNVLNNKRYIGSSSCLRRRLHNHLSKLNNNKHPNKHLQYSYNKYGQKALQFIILEYCENVKDTILFLEQKYLDLHPEYNNATIAVNNSGWHHSKESIEKMVSSRTGKIRILRDHKYSTPSPIKNPNYINKQKMKPVEQYTIEGVYIRGYDSISSAARSINRKREGIRDCCSGRQMSAYGYTWKYKEGGNNE